MAHASSKGSRAAEPSGRIEFGISDTGVPPPLVTEAADALDAEILAATEHALAAEGFAGGQGLTFRVFAEVMAGLRER